MFHRSEIDGLRAIAVIPVILFHAGFELFNGGFVGVDVFFVISGYLITTILIEEIENKRFSIVNFYERRARRILPALFFVMLASIPFAWMWMLPNQMKDFSQSLVAVSLFVSNIFFWGESGYFDAAAEEKPLLHTWSLAVEEQYYLLFPIFLILAWRFGKNRVFWMIVVMATISLLLSEWGWRNAATANFYLAPTRAWELFAGSIAAFIAQKQGVQKNNLLALSGLAAIIFSIYFYDETTPFPSVYALLPVIGVVLLILYANKETIAAQFLSNKMLVGVGLISYSAYLWHQPLFAFAKIRIYDPSEKVFVVLSIISFIIAYISWKYIEMPFRRKENLFNNKFSLFSSSIILLIAFMIFGLVGIINNGYEASSDQRIKFSKLAKRIEINHGISSACEGDFTLSNDCSTSQTPDAILWGDSFAMHLYQGINASNSSAKIRQITTSSCSPILGISRLNFIENKGYDWAKSCIEFNDKAFEWLKTTKSVEFIILSSPFSWVGKENVMDRNGDIYKPDKNFVLRKFKQTIKRIQNLGVGVVVVSPTPQSEINTGNCLVKKYQFNSAVNCEFRHSKTSYQFEFLTRASSFVPVYWLNENICHDQYCAAELHGKFIYRDSGHLSREGSFLLGKLNNWYDEFKNLALSKISQNH